MGLKKIFRGAKASLKLTGASFILLCAGLASCGGNKYHMVDGMIWNTSYHITYEGSKSLEDSIMKVLEGVDRSLNVFDTTSLVSKVNLADTIIVDQNFIDVYKASRTVNRASKGMFDPTLSPLITAWGFGKGHTPTADTARVEEILKYTGITKTHLQSDTLVKNDPRISFNFSAIAKGYGCDALAKMFKRNKVSNYLIEIGGEIAVGGVSPIREQWRVSIDKPVVSDTLNHESSAVIKITDAGMATSGNYRNRQGEAGATYGHTISPVTGRPVATDVISATVIAPNAMMADAMATACMASGKELAQQMILDMKYEAFLIFADSTTWYTPNLRQFLE